MKKTLIAILIAIASFVLVFVVIACILGGPAGCEKGHSIGSLVYKNTDMNEFISDWKAGAVYKTGGGCAPRENIDMTGKKLVVPEILISGYSFSCAYFFEDSYSYGFINSSGKEISFSVSKSDEGFDDTLVGRGLVAENGVAYDHELDRIYIDFEGHVISVSFGLSDIEIEDVRFEDCFTYEVINATN